MKKTNFMNLMDQNISILPVYYDNLFDFLYYWTVIFRNTEFKILHKSSWIGFDVLADKFDEKNQQNSICFDKTIKKINEEISLQWIIFNLNLIFYLYIWDV